MYLIPGSTIERLKTDGFLLVPLNKEAAEAVSATFEAAYPFFHAPLEEKVSNKLSQDSGYRPMGVEYSQSPDRPDQVESFTASVRTRSAIAELQSVSAQLLFECMLKTIDIFERIAEEITIQLANEVGDRPASENLYGAFRRWSRMQLNYSRPSEVTKPFINELHEDGNLITVACTTGPGLERQTATGAFVPITTRADEVIVMPGEIAWLLSGGQISPLYHRVQPESCFSERMALLFFGDINPRFCEPWVKNEINANVDIGARVLTNANRYGLQGFTLE